MLQTVASIGQAASPYRGQPPRAFWRSAVAQDPGSGLNGLWLPKATITNRTAIATYGSCFAQHVSRALRRRGLNWMDCEPPPAGMTDEHARAFGYGLFSSRTGNIYTAAMLRQWCEWALNDTPVPAEVWTEGDRLIDPFRPRIEPEGFADLPELLAARACALAGFRVSIETANLLIFTLGLTECWRHSDGFEYPLCPGTAGGMFDPERHFFTNQDYPAIVADLTQAIALMQRINPGLRLLLSVSPVPLVATATSGHVVTATTYSKSVLRAAAGTIAAINDSVDYFPSFEMITSPVQQRQFFAANRRDVTEQGVQFVMREFFAAIGHTPEAGSAPLLGDQASDAAICEEELLAAFGAGG